MQARYVFLLTLPFLTSQVLLSCFPKLSCAHEVSIGADHVAHGSAMPGVRRGHSWTLQCTDAIGSSRVSDDTHDESSLLRP